MFLSYIPSVFCHKWEGEWREERNGYTIDKKEDRKGGKKIKVGIFGGHCVNVR